jgi:hypothetical protein
MDEALIVLDKLVHFHKMNAKQHGWKYHNDMHLFSDQKGRAIGSLAGSLGRALDDAGLL